MLLAVIRGGGDLASGIAIRLHRSGIKVVITEIQQPLTVRRFVSFGSAVYSKSILVEEKKGILFQSIDGITEEILTESIPVIVDPDLSRISKLQPQIIVDARMCKTHQRNDNSSNAVVIGIGPGFVAEKNCTCVVETKRGPFLGRVYWNGAAEPDTGIPDRVDGFEKERVLRAPCDGVVKTNAQIGDIIESNELIATMGEIQITAPFRGVLRGLIHEGIQVQKGMKIGDLDPRCDPLLCSLVSDKALAVAGGVLEAILSMDNLRKQIDN
jgi:xanthine dehydrogenase accessory factor